MRKSLLTLLFAFLATCVMGQTLTVEYGDEWKKTNVSEINDMDFVGTYNNYTIATSHRYATFIGNYMKKECMVLALDNNKKISKNLLIEESKDDEVLASSINNGKLYLLTYRKDGKKESFNRWVVDLESMSVEGKSVELFANTRERKDDTYHWVAQTEDKSVTGLVFITTNRKSDKFDARQFLLDEEMNIEWQHDYPLYSISHILVTEDGEILTLGRSVENDKARSNIYVSLINEDNSHDVSVATNLVVYNTRLLCYRKGKVLFMGLGHSVNDDEDVRYFGGSIDMAKGELKASYKSFTQLEWNVFNGDNQGRNSDHLHCDKFMMPNCQATDFGAVGTVQARWSVETCNTQGACNIKSYLQGVMLFAIDDEGEILWHFPIRSDYAENGLPCLTANSIIVKGNDVYFLQTEHAKWPETYNLAKSMKTLKLQRGSKVIGVYHVTPDGEMSKTRTQLSMKAVLAGSAKPFNNGIIGFLTTGKGVTPVGLKL